MGTRRNKRVWFSKEGRSNSPLSRDALAKLRLKARRRGCWFRELKSSERRLLDLTIRVVQFVRSVKLAKVVSSIVQVLEKAMESRISVLIRTEGKDMAKRLSKVGTSLSCKSANGWASDRGFWQYLTILKLDVLGGK